MANKKIWKYELEVRGMQEQWIPEGAQVLTLAVQHGRIFAWIMVDPDAEVRPWVFEIYGTGHAIPEGQRMFLGTVFQNQFVWHVFLADDSENHENVTDAASVSLGAHAVAC